MLCLGWSPSDSEPLKSVFWLHHLERSAGNNPASPDVFRSDTPSSTAAYLKPPETSKCVFWAFNVKKQQEESNVHKFGLFPDRDGHRMLSLGRWHISGSQFFDPLMLLDLWQKSQSKPRPSLKMEAEAGGFPSECD